MNAKRKKSSPRQNSFGNLIALLALPLLAVNLFAAWRVFKVAAWLDAPLFGSIYDGPAQLATLLLVNTAVLLSLLAVRNG